MNSPRPIVLERDAHYTPEDMVFARKITVWRVFVHGVQVKNPMTQEPDTFTTKRAAENAAQFVGRYIMKPSLGDMVAFHIQYTERPAPVPSAAPSAAPTTREQGQ